MICWDKWKRYVKMGCLFVVFLVGTMMMWQSETEEKTLPVMVQAEDAMRTDDYIELRIARDRHRSEARELLAQAIEAEEDNVIRKEKQTALWQSDKNRQAESEIETIIKARGYDDARGVKVAYLLCNRIAIADDDVEGSACGYETVGRAIANDERVCII